MEQPDGYFNTAGNADPHGKYLFSPFERSVLWIVPMTLRDCCQKNVVEVPPHATVMDVVMHMDRLKTGCAVITDKHIPVGILTDRDIVTRVMAKNRNPHTTLVNDVMSRNLMVLPQTMGFYEALQLVRNKTFRRIPVVDERGILVGLVTVDDLFKMLA